MDHKKIEKWNKKAKNYARYQEGEDRFEAKVLKEIRNLGIDFKNRTVIDIGCGSGVYTLRVAKNAKKVTALDFSSEMIKVLLEDAKMLNLSNLVPVVSSWDDYTIEEEFDIAFCTMSPAVKNENQLEKMHKSAKKKIFLGWFGQREARILDAIFKAHNLTYTPPNGAQKAQNWLEKNDIPYKEKIFNEIKSKRREFQEAVKNFSWHLEIRGAMPQKDKIEEILQNFRDENGIVHEKYINQMKLLIWR